MKSHRHIRQALLAFAIGLLILGSHVTAGETIVDEARGFTLSVPDGFVANSNLIGLKPDIIHGFILGDPTDDKPDIILLIETLGGTIGRERIKAEDLPPGFQGQVFTTQWHEFEVDAFEIPEVVEQLAMLTYNVQIPLKRAAIQVKLVGPAERRAEMKSLLTTTLAGLQGESNWLKSAAPSSPVTSSKNYGLVLLAMAIVVVVGGLIGLWFISRIAPKGTVLVIAIGIWVCGALIGDVHIRELLMLAGAMKMLGFAGGILGLVDFFRRRTPPDKATP